jgi:hypothetical protein
MNTVQYSVFINTLGHLRLIMSWQKRDCIKLYFVSDLLEVDYDTEH